MPTGRPTTKTGRVAARAVTLVAAGVAAGVAMSAPAHAEGGFGPGTYAIKSESGEDQGTWTVAPCPGREDDFIPCLSVAKTGGGTAPWTADALYGVGAWTLKVVQPDLLTCDGHRYPTLVSYGWDAGTLKGYLGLRDEESKCSTNAASISAPFTLVPA